MHAGFGLNDRPTGHHVPGGSGQRGTFFIGLKVQSGIDKIVVYKLIVVRVPADQCRAVAEGIILNAVEGGVFEEQAIHPPVGSVVLKYPPSARRT